MNYEQILGELNAYQNSHPNLSSFWKFYIKLKKKAFEDCLLECQRSIDILKVCNDINPNNLLFIYLYLRSVST